MPDMSPARETTRRFTRRPAAVQVQSVLYDNTLASIDRAVTSLARSADLAIAAGVCSKVVLRYGDSSSVSCLSPEALATLRAAGGDALSIEYLPFSANLGSARGHNELAEGSHADFLLIQNPDIVVCPRLLETLLAPFAMPGVGMTEAKQLPIEHPKDYDPVTGETSWATTACAMIPTAVFTELGGFDAESFFLYCDDVDFSWRVRSAGLRVLFQPAAVVFHDKRLSPSGAWQPSAAERYYSAEAALFLAYKWSRPDLVEDYLASFARSCNADQLRAARVFKERRDTNNLPDPVDPAHKVGQFEGLFYAKHRYSL